MTTTTKTATNTPRVDRRAIRRSYAEEPEQWLKLAFRVRSAGVQPAPGYKQGDDSMRVLVVEDEARLAGQISAALGEAGYVVDRAADGDRAEFLGQTEAYDAIVLDLGLPGVDGLTVLRRWREAGRTAPVLVLTARGSWHEKVQGMDSGADDYVAKPFQMEEVVARLRALIRRASGQVSAVLTCGPVSLDARLARVTVDGLPVKLTSHEFRVLSYLMHHRGRVVSQSELVEHIYAQNFDRDSNTVEVFVARLRRKLGSPIIETVRGLGYRVAEPAGSPT